MITIEQRLFEGKEDTEDKSENFGGENKEIRLRYSPEVEQMFEKICQSIELYKAENIPFITEFLEFWICIEIKTIITLDLIKILIDYNKN